ncbi:MAG: phage tail assembly chaperone [Pseudomonadota bacterium]
MSLGFGVLKLSPSAFWSMTPRELFAALRPPGSSAQSEPPTRAALREMMATHPDTPPNVCME